MEEISQALRDKFERKLRRYYAKNLSEETRHILFNEFLAGENNKKRWLSKLEEKRKKNPYDNSYTFIECPNTCRVYLIEYISPFDENKLKNLRCPNCGKFVFHKRKTGRPSKYTQLELEILNSCKHKYVQDVLKNEVFGQPLSCIDIIIQRYSLMVLKTKKGAKQDEYKTIIKYSKRYVIEYGFKYHEREHRLKYGFEDRDIKKKGEFDETSIFD